MRLVKRSGEIRKTILPDSFGEISYMEFVQFLLFAIRAAIYHFTPEFFAVRFIVHFVTELSFAAAFLVGLSFHEDLQSIIVLNMMSDPDLVKHRISP